MQSTVTTTFSAAGKTAAAFTVARARRALPLVRRIVEDICGQYARLGEIQEMLEGLQRRGPIDQVQLLQGKMAASSRRIRKYLAELQDIGVYLRDYQSGQVEFPAIHQGRRTMLIWQLGDQDVRLWQSPTPEEHFAAAKRAAEDSI